ncbi:MAG: hypothetical protein UT15_C0016G0008 [Berkelbacteria bacterium GW2011_GWA1_39_10]|uniref:Uncharacterized protein n=1 Tax=Berkelbacteria bacterium GW2011_GWA1_39_10 TaxID=1618332 RepID=A0A0G0PLU6_9BACT|nr:MAG: hypothetical protein UT15_C0016G0008 [Berkelbacteria bacterium GW2011_GWA1_39_10]
MININLLPPQLKLQRIAAKRNASLIGICIVIVILFLVTGIVARSFESTVKANLDTTTSNVEKNTSQLDEYSDLQDLAFNINDRAKTADEISKNRTMWSQILQELSNSAPGDVQFENLIANADKSPNFVLQGNTTTEREIIKFKDKLENLFLEHRKEILNERETASNFRSNFPYHPCHWFYPHSTGGGNYLVFLEKPKKSRNRS